MALGRHLVAQHIGSSRWAVAFLVLLPFYSYSVFNPVLLCFQSRRGDGGCANCTEIHRGREGPERGVDDGSRADHQAGPHGHATSRRMRAPPCTTCSSDTVGPGPDTSTSSARWGGGGCSPWPCAEVRCARSQR